MLIAIKQKQQLVEWRRIIMNTFKHHTKKRQKCRKTRKLYRNPRYIAIQHDVKDNYVAEVFWDQMLEFKQQNAIVQGMFLAMCRVRWDAEYYPMYLHHFEDDFEYVNNKYIRKQNNMTGVRRSQLCVHMAMSWLYRAVLHVIDKKMSGYGDIMSDKQPPGLGAQCIQYGVANGHVRVGMTLGQQNHVYGLLVHAARTADGNEFNYTIFDINGDIPGVYDKFVDDEETGSFIPYPEEIFLPNPYMQKILRRKFKTYTCYYYKPKRTENYHVSVSSDGICVSQTRTVIQLFAMLCSKREWNTKTGIVTALTVAKKALNRLDLTLSQTTDLYKDGDWVEYLRNTPTQVPRTHGEPQNENHPGEN